MPTKLRSISISGFRGARKALDVALGSGFTIITGRNGAGKSTLIDAIEFGLSGHFARSSDESESGETLRDYIWWRGDKQVDPSYVKLSLVDSNGISSSILRTPGAPDEAQLLDQLIDVDLAPKDSLQTLLLTTIIRDESIARLSMDLNETKRFDFIKRAIGLSESLALERQTDALQGECKELISDLNKQYSMVRERLSTLNSELSTARSRAEQSSRLTISEIRDRIREFVPKPAETVTALLKQGNEVISDLRAEIDRIGQIQAGYAALEQRINDFQTKFGSDALNNLQLELKRRQEEKDSLTTELAELRRVAQTNEKLNQEQVKFSELVTAGEALGLQNGHCPLCGSAITETAFKKHLEDLKRAIDDASRAVATMKLRATQLQQRLTNLSIDIAELNSQASSLQRIQDDISRQKVELDARRHDVIGDKPLSAVPEMILTISKNVQRLDALVDDITASLSLDNVVRLEREVQDIQSEAAQLNSRVERAREAQRYIADIHRASREASMEIVDDRISSMLPLLKELYARLRPHVKWQEIDVHLRGDVRGFLRFIVGDELNPRFIYSSGQRRTLGLAFLLAVHLGRSWCKLNTLVLDDPVQHIDDYRALHLVEVLSAIRKTGRQVVCAVEDQAIADLLSRRLLTPHDSGRRVELQFSVSNGIELVSDQPIQALPGHALLSA